MKKCPRVRIFKKLIISSESAQKEVNTVKGTPICDGEVRGGFSGAGGI